MKKDRMNFKDRMSFEVGYPGRKDVFGISKLIQEHVVTGALLSRSIVSIGNNLTSWVVAKREGDVVGCACLESISLHMAEVRSVAVAPFMKGMGVGSEIMKVLCATAKKNNITVVYAYTRADGFFRRFGFEDIQGVGSVVSSGPLGGGDAVPWNPGDRPKRKGQKVMVADTRNMYEGAAISPAWPASESTRGKPSPLSESVKHTVGMHLPTRRQNARVQSG